ncbi:hypothetical protein LTR12_011000 [Friedmanniomyces endolithicus]|nr:hypothetical protein LTR12_011000 [Friedmanniomyces endolithicus]
MSKYVGLPTELHDMIRRELLLSNEKQGYHIIALHSASHIEECNALRATCKSIKTKTDKLTKEIIAGATKISIQVIDLDCEHLVQLFAGWPFRDPHSPRPHSLRVNITLSFPFERPIEFTSLKRWLDVLDEMKRPPEACPLLQYRVDLYENVEELALLNPTRDAVRLVREIVEWLREQPCGGHDNIDTICEALNEATIPLSEQEWRKRDPEHDVEYIIEDPPGQWHCIMPPLVLYIPSE